MSKEREVFSNNLRKYIDSRGIDQKILADFLDTSEMSVSNWVNGVKYPRMGNIQRIADYFGIKKSDLIEDKSSKPVFTSTEYNYFPVGIAAGLPENIESVNSEKISIPDSIMGKWAGQSDIMIMRVNGESMNKTIPDQSLIAVKPTNLANLKDGDIVVYSDNHEYSVKRMYKQDEHIVFRPDSTDIRFTD